jgi:protein-tyrosine-phosphatase
MVELLVLCTGNAARSVMAGFMLEHLGGAGSDLHVVTAGTHTIDGQPMGMRTRKALSGIPELATDSFVRHRSRQVDDHDFARAELVVVMEADHVRFVRRLHPEAADRTAMIRHLCRHLEAGPGPLADRVARLHLADAALADADDVIDPAGRDEEVYAECVAELWVLCQQLFTLL